MIKMQKTYQMKKEEVERNWHLIDVSGKVLGRISTKIATLLQGKHKPSYTAHVDGGDYVVVINAKKVVVTGSKKSDKMYYRHSQYPGGLKTESFDKLSERDARKIIENAVWGMLPKNKLRDPRMSRLKVYVGEAHAFHDKFQPKK
jgi:large subunit ribosomal protein L13